MSSAGRERRRSDAPSNEETQRALLRQFPELVWRPRLQVALLTAIGGLLIQARGWPSPSSLITAGMIAFLTGAVRSVVSSRPWRAWGTWTVALAGAVITVVGFVWAATSSEPLAAVELWWPCWAFATALLLDPDHRACLARIGIPEAACVVSALVVAVFAASPWQTPADRTVFIGVLLIACVVAVLTRLEELALRHIEGSGLPRSSPTRRGLARFAALVALVTFLVTWALYGVIDLVPPLWKPESGLEDGPGILRSVDAALGMPGLSERAEDPTPVLEVRDVTGDEAEPRALYLREFVLDQGGWEFGSPVLERAESAARRIMDEDDGDQDLRVDAPLGSAVVTTRELEVTLLGPEPAWRVAEPRVAWLGNADSVTVGADQSLTVAADSAGDRTYRVGSDPRAYFGDRERPQSRPRFTSFPVPDLAAIADGRWLQQASDLRFDGSVDDYTAVVDLARELRETGTWQNPPAWTGNYRAFLEGARAGLCVHFAQAAALLVRLAGIPARVAVGYLAKEITADGQTLMARARDRHAWIEVRFDRVGWIAFEVTPPQAGSGAGEALLASIPSPELVDRPDDREQQLHSVLLDLLRQFFLAALLLGLLIFFVARQRRDQITDSQRDRPPGRDQRGARTAWRHYRELERIGERCGVRRAPGQTAAEYVERLEQSSPDSATPLGVLLRCYHSCRFGGATLEPDDDREIRSFLASFESRLGRASRDS